MRRTDGPVPYPGPRRREGEGTRGIVTIFSRDLGVAELSSSSRGGGWDPTGRRNAGGGGGAGGEIII